MFAYFAWLSDTSKCVTYWSTKKTTKWLDVAFSIKEAQDYLENFDPGGDNPNWVGTMIVDWEGNVVGWAG